MSIMTAQMRDRAKEAIHNNLNNSAEALELSHGNNCCGVACKI